MSPLELLAPEAAVATPFSVRLAERQRMTRIEAARAAAHDRRSHERRTASDLAWLRVVRLTGGTGYDVNLIDLSEGGALLELNAPLRPGLVLTLEMTGPGLYTAVPLEVLRCYIANLRGETAIYRGAVAFAHLIQLPGAGPRPASVAADFVGADRALAQLVDRCASARVAGASAVSLERQDVLGVLDSLRSRTATRGSDVLSRHLSDLLAAILPALHDEAERGVPIAALEERLRGLPRRWRLLLEPSIGRLTALIDHCVTAAEVVSHSQDRVAPPVIRSNRTAPAAAPSRSDVAPLAATNSVGSAFQKIVVRHADGEILKGYTQDFHPSRQQFSLWPSINATPNERAVVPVSRLKAVFFVRDFAGNPAYQDRKDFDASSQGRRVEVTFADGESVLGTTLSYRREDQGFFVTPADPATNNTRIYVVAKAVRLVRFL